MGTEASKVWYYTQTEKQTIEYRWAIKNYRQRINKRPKLEDFASKWDRTVIWSLVVHLNDDGDHMSVFLDGHMMDLKPRVVECTFRLLDEKSAEVATNGFLQTIQSGQRKGFSKFVSLEKMQEFECEEEFVVLCTVRYLSKEIPYYRDTKHEPLPQCQLAENMGQLLNSATFSDCILEVEGHELPAHRAVLAARSPVFAAMFQHTDTVESRQRRVKIKDLPHDTVQRMLEFIYTGRVENLDEVAARNLLSAADKYDLERLKALCAHKLEDGLTTDNCVELLCLGYLHNVDSLRNGALEFLANRGSSSDNQQLPPNDLKLVTRLLANHQLGAPEKSGKKKSRTVEQSGHKKTI